MTTQLARRIHPNLKYCSFSELYRDNSKYVYGLALRYVKDKTLAEDVTSEVFFKVYKNLARFKGYSQFKTWIYEVTRNTTLRKLRSERRHVAGRVEYSSGAIYDKVRSTQVEYSQNRERLALLEAGSITVSKKNREALELKLLGYNLNEIKAILGIGSVGTVKTRVHRGKRQLADFVQQYY